MAKPKKIIKKTMPATRAKRRSRSKEKDAEYFVEIKENRNVRIGILEAIKLVLRMLKEYENYKLIRQQKEEVFHTLRKELKKVSRIVGELKSSLPDVPFKEPRQPKIKKEKELAAPAIPSQMPSQKASPKTIPKIPAQKQITKLGYASRETEELRKLEAELSEIEDKLGSLK